MRILISRLDVSNKIWLTVEAGRNAVYDRDAEAASDMRLTTVLPARVRPADFDRIRTWLSFSCWIQVIGAIGRFDICRGDKAGRRIAAVFLAAMTLPVSGCGDDGIISRFMLKPDRIIVERRPDPVYDQLFPYYVELCATSQFRSKAERRGRRCGSRSHVYQRGLQGRASVIPSATAMPRGCNGSARPRTRCGCERRSLVSERQLGGGSGLRSLLSRQSEIWRASNPRAFRRHGA